MTRRDWPPTLGVALGYALVALAFAWPLPLHLGTRLLGDPGGDTGVYVWNQWVFEHEAVSGANPLTTRQILALSQRVDLSQHNYTAFLNLLALPLIPILGVVAAFNVVMLTVVVLTALCAYALARLAFPCTRLEAFAAGLAFAWSPVLVARTTGHISLVAAAPLRATLPLDDGKTIGAGAASVNDWPHAATRGGLARCHSDPPQAPHGPAPRAALTRTQGTPHYRGKVPDTANPTTVLEALYGHPNRNLRLRPHRPQRAACHRRGQAPRH